MYNTAEDQTGIPTTDDAAPDFNCPVCGTDQRLAPEGVTYDGSPHWQFGHCFKCGHRSGTDVPEATKMAADFEAFKAWQASQVSPTDRGIAVPDDPSEVAAMRERIAELEADLSGRNSPGFVTPEVPQFGNGS